MEDCVRMLMCCMEQRVFAGQDASDVPTIAPRCVAGSVEWGKKRKLFEEVQQNVKRVEQSDWQLEPQRGDEEPVGGLGTDSKTSQRLGSKSHRE